MDVKAERINLADLSGSKDEPESDKGFVERLRHIASIAGSVSALAKLAGISQGGMQRYMKGGEPTRKVLISLAESAGVSLEWLLTGKGSELPLDSSVADSNETYAYVPLYDARCSAGHGCWNEGAKELAQLAFTSYSLRKKGLVPSRLSAIRVDGDSMSGLLEDGDTVLIDHCRNQLEAEAVYVIRMDDHLYAKRLQRHFDGSVQIISENKAYSDLMVSKSQLNDLEIIGRVVWAGRWI